MFLNNWKSIAKLNNLKEWKYLGNTSMVFEKWCTIIVLINLIFIIATKLNKKCW
jgi:hypothetical protein